MITVFAPDGIGEVTPDTALAQVITAALADDPHGPLADGDVVVVTSKIISKHEGCFAPADTKPAVLRAETRRTVARRGERFAIVETRHGLVQAAAGIDASNVDPSLILTLPVDPDASARRLRAELTALTGRRLGVIVSDTAGRAWRTGQTDHAIGVAGVLPVLDYGGRVDDYGNPLQVTAMAVADELAAAADLVKAKLGHRPVAVVRGAADLVTDDDGPGLAPLLRPVEEDLFRLGTRESVLEALATVTTGLTGRVHDLEALLAAPADDLAAALADGLDPASAELVRRLVAHATWVAPPSD